jgi:predicted glycosyltransferase
VRVLIHVQSLSGAGHFVRAFEIARALAERHEVFMTDGGWPVPRRPAPVTCVALPRLERGLGDRRLRALAGQGPLSAVLHGRVETLERQIRQLRPEVLLIEHFPFSKWELEDEYRAAIAAARAAHPAARVVCSARDIVRRGASDSLQKWEDRPYRHRVLDGLTLFDLVLVHADPRFTQVEEHVPWIGETRTPLRYTGFVSEKLTGPEAPRDEIRSWLGGRPLVVASAGGNQAGDRLIAAAVQAWQGLVGSGSINGHVLVVFRPLRSRPGETERLRRLAGDAAVRVEDFDLRFLDWLSVAECGITHAGYNTCMNLLETRRRALVVPDARMSDQPLRARRLRELGLAEVHEDPEPVTWPAAIRRALARPRPVHDLDLDGAAATRRLLEAL